ncbi:MAG TPA: chorismate-binding protein [Eudoraea sp.]|nr:chorismate-binding protein [Eudoraea sp.]
MLTTLLKNAGQQYHNRLPFVLYRKAGTETLHGIFQKDAQLYQTRDFSETGFVFAPFDPDQPAILILPEVLMSEGYSVQRAGFNPRYASSGDKNSRKEYVQLVEKGIGEITAGKMTKVVLSRILEVPCETDPIELFHDLLCQSPDAFCYIWYHPKIGLWLGATPEMLLQIKNNTLKTISMAGTQRVKNQGQPTWEQKELTEQGLVTGYIKDALKEKVRDLKSSATTSVKAGIVWHLRTELSGSVHRSQLKEVLRALHPTPAVCGLPPAIARSFISANENFERGYYTGFLGELNLHTDNSTSLFVNLRCLQILNRRAMIYVGAGVTIDSVPEKEWQETVDKSMTMRAVLFNSTE